MGSNIVVLATGRTELAAIPELTRDFRTAESACVHVRIPPGGGALIPSAIEKLAKSAYWDLKGRGNPPDKFVVLVDADGRPEETRVLPFKESCDRLLDIPAPFLVTTAQWHLEAWFFAHAEALRKFLNRDLGSVDTSQPDQIPNPKLHLKHLLDSPYTSRIAGEIAAAVSPQIVAQRSVSFSQFVRCLENGAQTRSPV